MIPKKETNNILPPLLFAGTTPGEKKYILRLKKEGKIRSLAPKLYTPLPDEEVKDVVRSSWATIVGRLYPEAVVSFSSVPFRTGREIFDPDEFSTLRVEFTQHREQLLRRLFRISRHAAMPRSTGA